MIPGIAHFILAGADTTGCYVYDIFPDGSLTLEDEYVTSGSGSVFALGVLETLYKKGMSTEEGVQLAVTAINAALKRDSASGNGIDVMVITQAGVQDAVHEAVTYDVKINK